MLAPAYKYKGTVDEVYDGDTITVSVDLGFNVTVREKFRISGIDAPEVRGAERESGLRSRDFLRGKILGRTVILETERDKQEKYGRYLARVWFEDEIGVDCSVGEVMLKEGLATQYSGSKL